MEIRSATPQDFADLVAIGHKFFAFNPYRAYSSIDELSLIRTFQDLRLNHILLVVEHNAKIIGTAGAFIAPLYWNHDHLQGLEAFWWIDPEHRSGGVGSKLRKHLELIAKSKGIIFWHMVALKESMHEAVCAQYEKAGMQPVETVYMKVL